MVVEDWNNCVILVVFVVEQQSKFLDISTLSISILYVYAVYVQFINMVLAADFRLSPAMCVELNEEVKKN